MIAKTSHLSRFKKIMTNSVVLFISLVFVIFVAELLLRAIDRPIIDRRFKMMVREQDEALVPTDIHMQESLSLLWENTPNTDEHDERGFRIDNPFHFREPKYRVLFLGCSITYGLCGRAADSFPYIISEMAAGQLESLNAGVSGYSSFQGLMQLKEKGLQLNPDIVVISFFHGDDGASWITDQQLYERNRRLYRIGTPLFQSYVWRYLVSGYVRLTMFLYRDIKDREITQRVSPEDFSTYTIEMINEARSINAKPVIVVSPINSAMLDGQGYIDEYLSLLHAAAKELDVPIVDVKELGVNADPGGTGAYFFDHCHLTREGNKLMAQAIYSELEKLIDLS